MGQNVLERMEANNTDYKIAVFRQKQSLPYEEKVIHAETRAREFYEEVVGRQGKNVHVSVGGLDSITLLLFLRSIGINCPAISVSSLEDKSISAIHKQLGVISVKPIKSKTEVLREFGYPILSKETANKIALLQNPTETPAEVVTAIAEREAAEPKGTVKQRAARIIREAKRAKISMDYFLDALAGIGALPQEIMEEVFSKVKGAS